MAIMLKDEVEDNYVKIPNETAQAVEIRKNESTISLEALGLMVNLWCYNKKKWTLHKTELYKRFGRNKKTSVSSAWDLLVEHNYIIEFKFRNGRNWEYVYMYRITPYTEEEKKQRLNNAVGMLAEYGVESTSDFQQLKFNSPNSTVQNQHISNTKLKKDLIKEKQIKEKGTSLEIDISKQLPTNLIDDDEEKEENNENFEINDIAFQEFVNEFCKKITRIILTMKCINRFMNK